MSNIYVPVWIEALICLKEGLNTNQISAKLNITYSHIHKIKNNFIDKKWIVLDKKMGRENIFIWTIKGSEMYIACREFLKTWKKNG